MLTTAGTCDRGGPNNVGPWIRSTFRRRAARATPKHSPNAHVKRFSPLMRESTTSPGNHEWSSDMSSRLA